MRFAKWCALVYKFEPLIFSRIIGQHYYRKFEQGHLCKDFTVTHLTWTNSYNCGAIIPGHGYKGYHFIMVPCYKILSMLTNLLLGYILELCLTALSEMEKDLRSPSGYYPRHILISSVFKGYRSCTILEIESETDASFWI